MAIDLHRLEITTQNERTLAAYNHYAGEFIGGGAGVRSIFAAADADGECALVNAHAAALHMAQEAAPGFKKARAYLKRARKVLAGTTERERAFVTAINDLWRGDAKGALKRLRKIVAEHPGDIVTAKWAHYLALNLGDARAMLEIAETVLQVHRQSAEAWSMLAFAQAQSNAMVAAEQAASEAISLKPSEPLAHQTMALVFDAGGRLAEGIAFLTQRAPGWADHDLAVRQRNWWHLAMLHLDRGDRQRALEIFDKHLWGERRELAAEQVNAISALWRMELAGSDVGGRWDPIVAKVIERWHEHIVPLNDLHFVWALVRGGKRREAAAFLTSMMRHGEKDVTGIWESVAIPCAQGLVAYAEGRFAEAAELIGMVSQRLPLVGGSPAQRDAIVRTMTDASSKASRDKLPAAQAERIAA